ncbi:Negative regulatory protein YxlE [compost metagenome]
MKMHYGFDDLSEVDLGAVLPVIAPIIAIFLILMMTALFDLYRNRRRRQQVMMWTLIIICCNVLGTILYFNLGRKDREGA